MSQRARDLVATAAVVVVGVALLTVFLVFQLRDDDLAPQGSATQALA